jgi:23S rRNA (uracil1939-C5)-methyltransferase
MKRVGFDTAQLPVPSVKPSPQLYGYRNRFQVKTDGIKLGFVAEGSHKIALIGDCLVLNATCRSLLKGMLTSLPREDWQPDARYDWNFIDVDDDFPAEHIQLNQKRPFKQGNTLQNEWMKSWLGSRLRENSSISKVIELFCGSGNFTEVIAESKCSEIIAYESGLDAIKQLRAKHLPKVDARPINLFKPFIWKILSRNKSNTLVLQQILSGLRNRGKIKSHLPSTNRQMMQHALTVSLFIIILPTIDVLCSFRQHCVDQARQFVCCRCDCLCLVEPAT